MAQAIAAQVCAVMVQALQQVVMSHTAHVTPVSKLSPLPGIIGHNERN